MEMSMPERRLQPARRVVTLSLTPSESMLTVEVALLRLQQTNMRTVLRAGDLRAVFVRFRIAILFIWSNFLF